MIALTRRVRCAAAALAAAAALLTALSGAALGRNFRVSTQHFRTTWTELRLIEYAPCRVTLEGSFHSATFPKVRGTLIGSITRVDVAACTLGSFVALTETLPWHLRYQAFTAPEGLPRISSVRVDIVGAAFLTRVETFWNCLFVSTTTRPLTFDMTREAGGGITALTVVENTWLALFRALTVCPAEGQVRGSGGIAELGSTTAISISLI